MMKIVLFWAWIHACWLIVKLPPGHPWQSMTFDEYAATADSARVEFGLRFWMLLGCLCWLCFA